jgi:plasmid stabilization system protein ParE
MTSGFRILWTDHALSELEDTIAYLETNWTKKELQNLAKEIEKTIDLLSRNPFLFESSDLNLAVRRVVVAKKNTLYYRINGNTIEVLSFFSNRQNPQKRKT